MNERTNERTIVRASLIERHHQKDFGDILDIRVNKSGNYCLSDFVLLNLEAQTMAYNVVTSQCVSVNMSDTSYAARELLME